MPTDNFESDPSALSGTGPEPSGTEPLACVSCRARKLKCDRIKPACSRCIKVSNECVYPESRRKPTFKRRNVKELEARLGIAQFPHSLPQVEDYLKDVNKAVEDKADDGSPEQPAQPDMNFSNQDGLPQISQTPRIASDPLPAPFTISDFVPPEDTAESFFDHTQLMGLGMSEALPPLEIMEDLNNVFFTHQHHFIPIIHPGRYLQAFYGSPLMKPPAWGLIASYEAKRMLFTRSTMSSAKTVRLCHMMSLDRIDGEPLGLAPSLGPPLTWAELEERRRVFWGAFCFDAHASISTGWPSLINMEDVATRLPAPEDAFIADRKVESAFLEEVFQGATYGGFAGTVVACQIFKIILRHVHRTKPTDHPEDVMNGGYWKRHRELDNTLSSVFMFLPEKLRLPQNLRDPSATHANLNFHASIICLHHAAIEKFEKYDLPDSLKQTSIIRLKAAAEEIANIIKIASPAASIFKSPLCALSMYCATTVFVYLAKQDPIAGLTSMDLAQLEVIVHAMEAIARTHNITRAFLQQACLDIERNGLAAYIRVPVLRKYRNAFGEVKSNIPVLARSSVARHTEVSPILPGRLPLRLSRIGLLDPEVDMENKIGQDCFQAVLGAVTRNVAPLQQLDVMKNKRKRMSPSPGPELMAGLGGPPTSSASAATLKEAIPMPTSTSGVPMFPLSTEMYAGNINLPDRTSSSSSSPANQGSFTRAATGSSHSTPSMGLGNTAEENRVDLRAFRDRISTPIWGATDESFFAHINETMINIIPADGGDTWGILDADINWDATNSLG
ncbi:hypothetical protein G7Z17_g9110 [Cylindrodendrum hubeiense]|uniref:Zn(2)-C6 fungal-type domain-containing protein n=1 Tax=Cylindrodendrum hubeiense TaxID=595255 RepID=A0A9P5LDN8_9HYPO|nr:hypothetical protein G7Z17_g9110 [Cylindrodendrum hubeiense]